MLVSFNPTQHLPAATTGSPLFIKRIKLRFMKSFFSFLSLLFAIHAFAQTETFDIVSFTPPPGWKADRTAERVSYSKNEGLAFSVFGIYKSRAINAATESEFITEWNELVNQPMAVNITPLVKVWPNKGYTVFTGSSIVTTAKNGTYTVMLTSYAAAGKIISAMVYCSGEKDYKSEREAFLATINLLKKDETTNNTAAVAGNTEIKPAARTGNNLKMEISGINGVWVGFERGGFTFGNTSYNYSTHTYNYGMKYDMNKIEIKWKIFWSDGKYYEGIPHEGLLNYNPNDSQHKGAAGHYTMDKNLVTARLNNSTATERLFMYYPPNGLKLADKFDFTKCKPVDGLKLNGTYISADPMSFSYYKSIDKPIPSISFTKDGYFTDDNYIGDYSKEPNMQAGSGIYQISQFTLVLKYNDGRMIERAFTPYLNEDPTTCKIFYIGSKDVKLKL
jgi:hypothetical protein